MPKKVRRVDMTHIDVGLLADPEPFALELYTEPEQSVTKARWAVQGLLDSMEVDTKPPAIPSYEDIVKGVK